MPRPVLDALRRLWSPEKDEPAPAPTPAPVPEPTPAPVPAPVVPVPNVKPGPINSINYVRALLLLRKIPIKKLREEFLKLPLRQIGFILGFIVWLGLSYWLICLVWRALTLK